MKAIRFPEITENMAIDEKIKVLTEYLWQFSMAVYHELSNLSPDNFNTNTIKDMAQTISDILGLGEEDEAS